MKHYPEDQYLIGWTVYYYSPEIKSFKKYSSLDTVWCDLPPHGVQVVLRRYRQPDGSVRSDRLNGHDVYLENWTTEDLIKTGQNVSKLVKFGEMLPDDIFHPLFDAILKDINGNH